MGLCKQAGSESFAGPITLGLSSSCDGRQPGMVGSHKLVSSWLGMLNTQLCQDSIELLSLFAAHSSGDLHEAQV